MAEERKAAAEPPAIKAIRESIRQLGDQIEAYSWATARKRKVDVAVKMLRLAAEIQKQTADLIELA